MSTHSQPVTIKHIFNRGVRKSDIFLDDSDYRRFFNLLRWYIKIDYPYSNYLQRIENVRKHGISAREVYQLILGQYGYSTRPVNILAWVLMGNHFHLLLEERVTNGIYSFIHRVSTAYAVYFNRKYDFSGRLFQGHYKSVFVDGETQLLYLLRYVHLNPVEANIVSIKDLDSYKWSSWNAYATGDDDEVTNIYRTKQILGELNTVVDSTNAIFPSSTQLGNLTLEQS